MHTHYTPVPCEMKITKTYTRQKANFERSKENGLTVRWHVENGFSIRTLANIFWQTIHKKKENVILQRWGIDCTKLLFEIAISFWTPQAYQNE